MLNYLVATAITLGILTVGTTIGTLMIMAYDKIKNKVTHSK